MGSHHLKKAVQMMNDIANLPHLTLSVLVTYELTFMHVFLTNLLWTSTNLLVRSYRRCDYLAEINYLKSCEDGWPLYLL